jgi:KipI family sensor histidine kinase inhibitor
VSRFPISITPFGEQAVLIEWPEKIEEDILNDILQFTQHLKTRCLEPDHYELVPAYRSLTLISRDESIDFRKFERDLLTWYSQAVDFDLAERYLWKLPVCYDPEFGIDLDTVSHILAKTVWEIISLHTQQPYTVYGIGFLPGFMYLGGLPKALELPRKDTPRLKVSKGAVGLAGKQTGIYPVESPGGWNIIGNCPIPLFDASKETPCFVGVGDKVQFYGINKKEHELHTIQAKVGIYAMEKIKLND